MDVEHILFDMDGVIVDWFGGVCDLLGRDRKYELAHWPEGASTEEALGIDREYMWRLIEREGLNWWAQLKPLPWYRDVFELLSESEARISILSSPANSDYAASGKKIWIKKKFPHLANHVHLSEEKELFAAPGRLLIDDDDRNCQRFEDAGGQAVLFPQPWNAERVCSDNPFFYLRARLKLGGIIS